MGRPRTWDDHQLRAAVAASTTFMEVHQRLGLSPGGGSYSAVRIRVAELELDTSHFAPRRRTATPRRPPGGRPAPSRGSIVDRIDPDRLRRAVARSTSISETLRQLGIGISGGSYAAIKRAMERHDIDRSHFRGQGWALGTTGRTRNGARPIEELLVRDSPHPSTSGLRKRLLKEGLKEPRCELCGLTEWRERPAPLQLDHVNGDRRDNRWENLRLVCPNCHAQTDTWCGRNIGRHG